jgi:hypothetical protein
VSSFLKLLWWQNDVISAIHATRISFKQGEKDIHPLNPVKGLLKTIVVDIANFNVSQN